MTLRCGSGAGVRRAVPEPREQQRQRYHQAADAIGNEGGWAVIHRGIFNWRYVNNVLYLMQVFRYR